MTSMPDNGLVHLSSPCPVGETITRLESLLEKQGLTVFCRINHSGEAEKAGLKMRPTCSSRPSSGPVDHRVVRHGSGAVAAAEE